MAGVLQHLRSSTLNKRPNPASMVDGQVAINYASGSPGMFFKDSNGSLVKVGPVHVGSTAPNVSPASGGTAGNSLGEQWLDTSGGTYVFKIWDGGSWRSEAGEFVNSAGDTMTGSLTMGPAATLIFEGSTDDGFETTLTVVNPTVDRTITLPNVTGTVITTGDTGTVTSTMLLDGTILDADVNASAAIAGTKISPNFGSQTITTTGIVSAALGAAATPSITFTGDTNTGLYSPGADQVAISTGGTGRLFVDASGRVGVGAASSTARLFVSGSNASSNFIVNAGTTALSVYNDEVAGEVRLGAIDTSATNAKFLSFYTNPSGSSAGSERLRITSAGLVGVGVSSPAVDLHVANASGGRIRVGGAAGAGIEFNGSDTRIDIPAANTLAAYTNSIERARIDSSGRLLLGTSSTRTVNNAFQGAGGATIPLLSEGTDLTRGGFVLNRADQYGPSVFFVKSRGTTVGSVDLVSVNDVLGAVAFAGTDGASAINAATITALVDGTPASAATALVNGQTYRIVTVGTTDFTLIGASANTVGTVFTATGPGTGTGTAILNAGNMPGRIVLSTTAAGASSPTERMRITQNGFTKHSNTGAYLSTTAAYHEFRSDAGSGALTLNVSNSSATGNGLQSGLNSDGTAYAHFIGYSTSAAANRIIIWSNGNVVNTNNSYGAISDIKLKENIVDASSQWDDLKALQVRNYNFKEGQTHTQIGLVAQEVELVSPGLVTESPDRDEDGNDLGTVTKSVNYSVLYMKAVKALQEAMERIEQLEQRLTDTGIA